MQIVVKYDVAPEDATTITSLDDRDDTVPFKWHGINRDAFAADLWALVDQADQITVNGTVVLDFISSNIWHAVEYIAQHIAYGGIVFWIKQYTA